MAIDPNLLPSIKAALAQTVSPYLRAPSQGSDLYELYIWSLIIEAARNEGAAISYFDVHGNPVTTNFVFRTSPSRIFSTTHPYTHALIQFDGCPNLEAHIGVYVAGKSRVTHECDVAVLFSDAAETCRRESVHPKSTQLVLAAECKFYIYSPMGINLGRSYLGLYSEIKHTNRECFFVAATEAKNVQRLFVRHQKAWETGVVPNDSKSRPNRLRAAFEQAFRDFKLREGP